MLHWSNYAQEQLWQWCCSSSKLRWYYNVAKFTDEQYKQLTKTPQVDMSCSWLINSCALLISEFCNFGNVPFDEDMRWPVPVAGVSMAASLAHWRSSLLLVRVHFLIERQLALGYGCDFSCCVYLESHDLVIDFDGDIPWCIPQSQCCWQLGDVTSWAGCVWHLWHFVSYSGGMGPFHTWYTSGRSLTVIEIHDL